jgi:hypothetical protein
MEDEEKDILFYVKISINGSDNPILPVYTKYISEAFNQNQEFKKVEYYSSKEIPLDIKKDYNVYCSGGAILINDKGTRFSVNFISSIHNNPKLNHLFGKPHLQNELLIRMEDQTNKKIDLPKEFNHIPFNSGSAVVDLYNPKMIIFSENVIKSLDFKEGNEFSLEVKKSEARLKRR